MKYELNALTAAVALSFSMGPLLLSPSPLTSEAMAPDSIPVTRGARVRVDVSKVRTVRGAIVWPGERLKGTVDRATPDSLEITSIENEYFAFALADVGRLELHVGRGPSFSWKPPVYGAIAGAALAGFLSLGAIGCDPDVDFFCVEDPGVVIAGFAAGGAIVGAIAAAFEKVDLWEEVELPRPQVMPGRGGLSIGFNLPLWR